MFFEIKSNIKKYYESGCLPFLVDSVGYMDTQEPIVRADGFNCHHLLWVTDGEGRFTSCGETFVLKKRQGVFFREHTPHRYRANTDRFSSAWLTFYGLDGLLTHYGIGDRFTFTVNDALADSVRAMYLHCIGNSTVLSRSAVGYPLVTEFLYSCFAPSVPLAQKVDSYLEAKFAENLSLDVIAAEVGMNKYTLCKKYLSATGMTVIEKLKKIRTAKAKQYLTVTSYSAEAVGKMCGFDSPSYFGKVFREITGQTPGEYRIKHR